MRSKVLLLVVFASILLVSCKEDKPIVALSGEINTKYNGNYTGVGTKIRYRLGVDTITTADTFKMSILLDTIAGRTGVVSEFNESKLLLRNFLGYGITVKSNATYTNLFPQPYLPVSLAFMNDQVRPLSIRLVSPGVIEYNYNKYVSRFDSTVVVGKLTKL